MSGPAKLVSISHSGATLYALDENGLREHDSQRVKA